jgi:aspartyl-tRNA(Asn)/glutamyl-tRNA(Gln) amidotransferase subunit A
MTIADIRKQLSSHTVQEVVLSALERAEADAYHGLIEISSKRALERAKEIDERLKAGEDVGELAGIPFVAKDNMLTFGSATTAASKLLETFEAPFQSTAIERLEAAGAICIGKANLDAFAHGGSTENSAYGPTLNPHDTTRVPGGSSGGSASVVASDIVPFALGTDTGGSIRQPASFTGTYGMKPTFGAVSRYGVVAMASSTDVVGVIANGSDDVEQVMKIISGKDERDATTINSPYGHKSTKSTKKIGLISNWLGQGTDKEVVDAVNRAVEVYKASGFKVESVELPILDNALAVYYIVVPAEIASNLARYDGIRYGVRAKDASTLGEVYSLTRSQGFMPENKRRIMIGNYVLSSGYYDAYFQKAAKVRTLIINQFDDAFMEYDALIGPVSPTSAFRLGENLTDPLKMYLADQMTVSASLAGLPAISVPLPVEGMPIGLQIIGRREDDLRVIDLAKHLEEKNE